jgi:hypothetical protein
MEVLERDGKFYKKHPLISRVGYPIKMDFIEDGKTVSRYEYVEKEVGFSLEEISKKEYDELLNSNAED